MSSSQPQTQAIIRAQELVRRADRVVALTGAGISTDSGIPDFRGPAGLWTKDPEAEKLSNIHYYLQDPKIRRKAWHARMHAFLQAPQPNAGHAALVSLERRGKLLMLVTQNIDGLHQMAGNSAERIVEVHGTMRRVRCMSCDYRVAMECVVRRLQAGEEDPDCPQCGGILKSATISFGQNLVAEDLARAEQSAQQCDLLLAVGSTLSVFPVAGLVPVAKHAGAPVVIVNGSPTEMDALADVKLTGPISELLNALLTGTN